MSWQQWVAGPNGLVNGNNQVTKAGIYSLLKKLNIFFKIYKFSNQNLQTFLWSRRNCVGAIRHRMQLSRNQIRSINVL